MEDIHTDCRNLAAYFFKRMSKLALRRKRPRADDDPSVDEEAVRSILNFKEAFNSAVKWLSERTDVPQANMREYLINRYDGPRISIRNASLGLDELNRAGQNANLLGFMWQNYPEQCKALKLPNKIGTKESPKPSPQLKRPSTVNKKQSATAVAEALPHDTAKKNQKRMPDNPDVRDLCAKLEKNERRGDDRKSLMDVAKDFTRGNAKKAASLLRQARRYRHLWEQ